MCFQYIWATSIYLYYCSYSYNYLAILSKKRWQKEKLSYVYANKIPSQTKPTGAAPAELACVLSALLAWYPSPLRLLLHSPIDGVAYKQRQFTPHVPGGWKPKIQGAGRFGLW